MFSVFVFISMFVCPSCVIPQSSRAPRFALLHVCSHKTLLQRNSHFFSSTPSTLLSSSRLLFTNFCSLILPKICLPVSAPLPTQSYLSPSCSSSFFSHSFHMFSPIHSPILPCLTLPLSPSPPFSLSLSFTLPPNQSHMLEKEAGRSDDGHNCVECRPCGTVLGVSRVRMYKLSLQMLRLLVIGCSHM